MILVTSAAGNTGQNVIRALVARGAPVRAFVRREAQVVLVRALGASEVRIGDFRDPAAVRSALEGVEALYHICPRLSEMEVEIGRTVIEAARSAGVSRFVYHGVAHPYIAEMPHHWDKLQVQILLERSDLPFSVIQPTNYMQNITWAWDRLVQTRRYELPYSADTPLTWVDAEEVAEAAARVLLEPGHDGAAYELAGADGPLTRREICERVSKKLGWQLEPAVVAWETWRKLPRYVGWEQSQMRRLKKMFAYYDQHGFRAGNPNVLGWLLGRKPRSLSEFIDRLIRSRQVSA